uniref:NADH dehydrogenase subunit 6 n=1 Tax=Ecnomus latus TaxID=623472 RepID=A0A9E8RT35_9NEOP|nr:NADH dehydrogenase subunit 6 [Ecnomus latus]UZZ43903.1 NADH dehydrogenase subunit 6 [Ecnomus latus]
MMKIMINWFMINNLYLILLNHPMSISMLLIIQILISCIMMNFILQMTWFSYILFIIIIGGLMILFMFMCAMSSNNKFKLNLNYCMFISLLSIMLINWKNMKMINLNYKSIQFIDSFYIKNESMNLSKFLFPQSIMLLCMMIIILLFIMIIINKMNYINNSPFRQIN